MYDMNFLYECVYAVIELPWKLIWKETSTGGVDEHSSKNKYWNVWRPRVYGFMIMDCCDMNGIQMEVHISLYLRRWRIRV